MAGRGILGPRGSITCLLIHLQNTSLLLDYFISTLYFQGPQLWHWLSIYTGYMDTLAILILSLVWGYLFIQFVLFIFSVPNYNTHKQFTLYIDILAILIFSLVLGISVKAFNMVFCLLVDRHPPLEIWVLNRMEETWGRLDPVWKKSKWKFCRVKFKDYAERI